MGDPSHGGQGQMANKVQNNRFRVEYCMHGRPGQMSDVSRRTGVLARFEHGPWEVGEMDGGDEWEHGSWFVDKSEWDNCVCQR